MWQEVEHSRRENWEKDEKINNYSNISQRKKAENSEQRVRQKTSATTDLVARLVTSVSSENLLKIWILAYWFGEWPCVLAMQC